MPRANVVHVTNAAFEGDNREVIFSAKIGCIRFAFCGKSWRAWLLLEVPDKLRMLSQSS
jgi:hypothetical protein